MSREYEISAPVPVALGQVDTGLNNLLVNTTNGVMGYTNVIVVGQGENRRVLVVPMGVENRGPMVTGGWENMLMNTTVSFANDEGYDFETSPNGIVISSIITLDAINTTQLLINKLIFNPIAGGDINAPIDGPAVYRNGNDHMVVIDANGEIVVGHTTVGLMNEADSNHPAGTPISANELNMLQQFTNEGGYILDKTTSILQFRPGGKFHDGFVELIAAPFGGNTTTVGQITGYITAVTTWPMVVLPVPTTMGLKYGYEPFDRITRYLNNSERNNEN